jgi:hypothetical protein
MQHFELLQRKARMFSFSPLVPDHLRKGTPEQAMANCYIALTLAEALGEMPLIVMQNIHVINGKAGFAAKYMIARANVSGKFKEELDWDVTGKGPDLSVTCFATLVKSGKRVSMTCDMAMARAEGWTNNKKYSTMPEVMLRYRSASFLINFYAPEVMLGYRTTEELEDISAASGLLPEAAEPLTAGMLIDQSQDAGDPPHNPETGEIGEFEEPEQPEQSRTDEQHGDQHDGTEEDPLPPYQALVDDITERATNAAILGDVIGAENDFRKHRDGLPEAVAKAVDEAIAAGKAKFAKK